jgi:hypothetical protein
VSFLQDLVALPIKVLVKASKATGHDSRRRAAAR